jgi:hypothetical protein
MSPLCHRTYLINDMVKHFIKIGKLIIKINHQSVVMNAEMLDQIYLTKQEEKIFAVNRSNLCQAIQ